MTEYRPEIDGLRAVAVTAVVLYHLGVPGVTGGFVGVDVFFVISGYVITRQLWSHRGEPLGAMLAGFYARRARRIVPALALVILATLGLGKALLLPFGEQQDLGRSAIAAALFIANLNFRFGREEYFTQPAELQPLLHTWSLAVEEQFYLVWPLLLGLLWLGGARRRADSGSANFALAAVLLLSIASFAVSLQWTREEPRAAFFLLPARFWELGVGAALALFERGRGSTPGAAGLSAIGLAGIVVAVLSITPQTPFPGYAALLPVASTALVLVAGGREGIARRLLASRPFVFTGTVSYAWYLWHWPLLAFVRCVNLGEHVHAAEAGAVVLAYGLACLSTRYIEDPIRKQRWRIAAGPAASLATAATLVFVATALAAALWLEARARYRDEYLAHSVDCMRAPGGLGIEDPRACALSEGSAGVVYLTGDSHAAHWAPAVAEWAKSRGLRAVERTYAGCVPPIAPPSRYFPGCEAFSRSVLAEIAATAAKNQRTFVIIGANWARRADLLAPPVSRASRTLDTLASHGVATLVIGATPRFDLPVPACIGRRGEPGCRKARAAHDAEVAVSRRALQEAVARNGRARLLDPTEAFCDTAWCYPARDGTLVFRDETHLTRQGAMLASTLANADFDWLLEAERPAR